MEARVRQTVSGVKTAMDAKKVEGETKELTEKIVALETTVEEAVNSCLFVRRSIGSWRRISGAAVHVRGCHCC